ncbi:MAG: hypothetical protein R6U46_03965 [Marinilabilia sp.]
MSAINKYRYFQAIFIGLPMGLLSLFYGTKDFLYEKNDTIENYQVSTGAITQLSDTVLFDKKNNSYYEVTKITINNVVPYFTRITTKRNQIKGQLNPCDTITVFFDENSVKEIKAIRYKNSFVVEFKKSYWVGVFFILWGVFWTGISVLYIYKHSQDLTGDEKKFEN